jgi:hypothetical protein
VTTIIVGASGVVSGDTIITAVGTSLFFRLAPLANKLIKHWPWFDGFKSLEEHNYFSELRKKEWLNTS